MMAPGERAFIGGLMRCCIATLYERTEPGTDGERQPCKYCKSGAVFKAAGDGKILRGTWKWDHS